ncbi:MAG: hypothetical protein LBI05_06190 [Planctomycetaceae bacterium]|jgi:hypothetical protein|nr:hypothetical protein [Planctomycetaceae bacterium]
MLALALLPLVLYFAFLTRLYFRQTPTVLNGSLDFMLLAWGLFGLITFGPGRLLIPIYVFTAWGISTWIFWLGFYFVMTRVLARPFKNRLVLYHCQRELVLPPFYILAQQIDPKTEWSGNVLSFHGLGVQWSAIHDRWGGWMLLVPTNPSLRSPHQEMLQAQLANLCRTLIMPKRRIRWFGVIFTLSLLCLVIGLLLRDFPGMMQQFYDCWLPIE